MAMAYYRLLKVDEMGLEDVVIAIFEALLAAACDNGWEQPSCAQGSISRMLGTLQGRVDLNAKKHEGVLPQDIKSYRELLGKMQARGIRTSLTMPSNMARYRKQG